MSKNPVDRIEFLAKKFNVVTDDEIESLHTRMMLNLIPQNNRVEFVVSMHEDGLVLALFRYKIKNEVYVYHDLERLFPVLKDIRPSEKVFTMIVQSDPTEHKEYVQWMLTTFVRFIKENNFDEASRFVVEDLPIAKEYLEIFFEQRYKPKFKKQFKKNNIIGITDPSDINQYRDLSQLFEAIDPFLEKNISELERKLKLFQRLGQGEVPYKDSKFTVFVPKSWQASTLFRNYSNWCTTKAQGSYINYVNQKTPLNEKSKLYIIIDNNCFLNDEDPNKSDKMYQFHFESNQLMNKSNSYVGDFEAELFSKSKGLGDYFYKELTVMAKKSKTSFDSNCYVKTLLKFGFTDILFDVIDEEIDEIDLYRRTIKTLPDMSKFKKLEVLYLFDVGLTELHPSVCNLENLTILSIPNNKLNKLPSNIGNLKGLKAMVIYGNKIVDVPDSISKLDRQNGGSLEILSYRKEDLTDSVFEKLKKLLPTIEFNQFNAIGFDNVNNRW